MGESFADRKPIRIREGRATGQILTPVAPRAFMTRPRRIPVAPTTYVVSSSAPLRGRVRGLA